MITANNVVAEYFHRSKIHTRLEEFEKHVYLIHLKLCNNTNFKILFDVKGSSKRPYLPDIYPALQFFMSVEALEPTTEILVKRPEGEHYFEKFRHYELSEKEAKTLEKIATRVMDN